MAVHEKVLFDTSILIDYLRGFKSAKAVIERAESGDLDCVISVVTVAEIYAGVDGFNDDEITLAEALLSLFVTIPVDYNIAKRAGELKNKSGVLLPDCIIAATALSSGCKVWTTNIRDFKRITKVTSEKPY